MAYHGLSFSITEAVTSTLSPLISAIPKTAPSGSSGLDEFPEVAVSNVCIVVVGRHHQSIAERAAYHLTWLSMG